MLPACLREAPLPLGKPTLCLPFACPYAAGNLLVSPACALLFLDFSSGDVLRVAGEAEVLHTDRALPGARVSHEQCMLAARLPSRLSAPSSHGDCRDSALVALAVLCPKEGLMRVGLSGGGEL